MRHLTVDECHAFGEPGTRNETTPMVENGVVVAVTVYTRHASGSITPHRRDHGHSTYGRLVDAADARAAFRGDHSVRIDAR